MALPKRDSKGRFIKSNGRRTKKASKKTSSRRSSTSRRSSGAKRGKTVTRGGKKRHIRKPVEVSLQKCGDRIAIVVNGVTAGYAYTQKKAQEIVARYQRGGRRKVNIHGKIGF